MCQSTERESVVSAPCFEERGSWSAGYDLATSDRGGVIVGPGRDNPNVFAQPFATEPGDQYRIVVEAAGADEEPTLAATQINWLAQDGSFLGVSQREFEVGTEPIRTSVHAVAPPDAVQGFLYVAPGGDSAVLYNEMSLFRLQPLADFFFYRFAGISGTIWSALFLSFLLLTLLWMFYPKELFRFFAAVFQNLDRLFPVLTVAIVIALLMQMEAFYEQNYDAQAHQGFAEIVWRWNAISLDLGGNAMMSFGIQHLVKPYLSPAFIVGWLSPADIRVPVQAAVLSVMLLLLLAAIARDCGAPRNMAYGAAMVAIAYCTVPLLGGYALTLNVTLGLFWLETSIAAVAATYCFVKIGTVHGKWRYLPGVGLGLVIVWYFLALPYMSPYFTLATAAMCGCALLASRRWGELRHKLFASAIIVAVLVAAGVPSYVLGIFTYTPQMFFDTLYDHDFNALFFSNTSLLLAADRSGGMLVYLFFGLAALGAAAAWTRGNDVARRIVFSGIGLEVAIHALSAVNAVLEIMPLTFTYIEQVGLPVIALLAGVGFWAVLAVFGYAAERSLTWIGGRLPTPTRLPAANERHV